MPVSFDILGSFFNDTGFTITATIDSVDYTVIRMQRDDSKMYTEDGVSSDVAFSIIIKVSDKTIVADTLVTIDAVVYRAKTVHLDGAGLTQRVELVQQYG